MFQVVLVGWFLNCMCFAETGEGRCLRLWISRGGSGRCLWIKGLQASEVMRYSGCLVAASEEAGWSRRVVGAVQLRLFDCLCSCGSVRWRYVKSPR